jgi:hypothetical protein
MSSIVAGAEAGGAYGVLVVAGGREVENVADRLV